MPRYSILAGVDQIDLGWVAAEGPHEVVVHVDWMGKTAALDDVVAA